MEYGRGGGRHKSITHIQILWPRYKISATAAASSNLKLLHSDWMWRITKNTAHIIWLRNQNINKSKLSDSDTNFRIKFWSHLVLRHWRDGAAELTRVTRRIWFSRFDIFNTYSWAIREHRAPPFTITKRIDIVAMHIVVIILRWRVLIVSLFAFYFFRMKSKQSNGVYGRTSTRITYQFS